MNLKPEAKVQLMENMAHLWLQQEVKDLETGHETKGKYSSPYLVVDHMAMINHMFAIKDIVASKKFAVIVPNAGEVQKRPKKIISSKYRVSRGKSLLESWGTTFLTD